MKSNVFTDIATLCAFGLISVQLNLFLALNPAFGQNYNRSLITSIVFAAILLAYIVIGPFFGLVPYDRPYRYIGIFFLIFSVGGLILYQKTLWDNYDNDPIKGKRIGQILTTTVFMSIMTLISLLQL